MTFALVDGSRPATGPAPASPTLTEAGLARDLVLILETARQPWSRGDVPATVRELAALEPALALRYGSNWHRRLDALVVLGTTA